MLASFQPSALAAGMQWTVCPQEMYASTLHVADRPAAAVYSLFAMKPIWCCATGFGDVRYTTPLPPVAAGSSLPNMAESAAPVFEDMAPGANARVAALPPLPAQLKICSNGQQRPCCPPHGASQRVIDEEGRPDACVAHA